MLDDRKARIIAIASRAKAKRLEKNNEFVHEGTVERQQAGDEDPQNTQTLTFRNYNLSEQSQKQNAIDNVTTGKPDHNTNANTTLSQSFKKKRKTDGGNKVKSELELALMEAKRKISTMGKHNNNNNNSVRLGINTSGKYDAANLAPNKVNWDLKRDIESKISKLERKTQKAIVELLRERLEREATEADGLD